MAQSTLAVLAHPEFPQLYADAIDEAIACVDRILSRYSASALLSCEYEYPETVPGACNGEPCCDPATVFSLADEKEYCSKHFRWQEIQRSLRELEVSRG